MEQNDIAVKAEHIPIYRLEEALKACPHVDVPLFHDFCTGVYARTILIPAGTMATGAVHKDECFFFVRNGCVLLTTDEKPVVAESGFMVKTSAGSKRAAYAIIDTLITTVHANPEEIRDEKEIWDNYTVPPPDNILEILEKTKLEGV